MRSAQVPEVAAFGFNATVQAGGPAGGSGDAFLQQLSFPLFAAGERRAQAPWAGRGPLPAGLQDAYVPSQILLLCVSQARHGLSSSIGKYAVAGYMLRRGIIAPSEARSSCQQGSWPCTNVRCKIAQISSCS